jgi:hypothetical protein
MATPSYWATGFKKAQTAAFTDVADWLTAIRTMLTATLDVADRWTESPSGTFTSPADPVSGSQIRLAISRTSAVRLQFVATQIVNSVAVGLTQGECDISGSVQAWIFAGPYHFWTEVPGGDYAGMVGVDTTPEPANLITTYGFFKVARNVGQADFDQHCDYWMAVDGNADGGFISRARCQGPFNVANNSGYEVKTAGGSFVYFPAVGVAYPTNGSNANQRFCGTFPQFVYVDNSWVGGQLVPVPVDVGVIGIFYVCSSKMTNSNANLGPRIAVRYA